MVQKQTYNAVPVVLVVSPARENKKVCIKATNVIDNYDDTSFNYISPGLPSLCSVMTSEAGTDKTPAIQLCQRSS